MLDTVVLRIPHSELDDINPTYFTPDATGLLFPPYTKIKRGGLSCVCNPTKEHTERFGTMPRLTLQKQPRKGGINVSLKTEVSVPKLLLGNNFDELCDADFPEVCATLEKQLRRMGVYVPSWSIEHAQVSTIHYSKNIPLTDHTTCGMVIQEVAKGSIGKHLETSRTVFSNDGSALKYHANSYEITLYDKLKDLQKGKRSDGRSIENNNAVQLPVLEIPFKKPFDVLRLEVRLGMRQKLRSLFKVLEIDTPLEFASLFSEDISGRVLRHYWQAITPDLPLLAASQSQPDDLYNAIFKASPQKKPCSILKHIGAIKVVEAVGLDGLQALVKQHATSRQWYRLKQDISGLQVENKPRFLATQIIEKCLLDFQPIRLQDYIAPPPTSVSVSGVEREPVQLSLFPEIA